MLSKYSHRKISLCSEVIYTGTYGFFFEHSIKITCMYLCYLPTFFALPSVKCTCEGEMHTVFILLQHPWCLNCFKGFVPVSFLTCKIYHAECDLIAPENGNVLAHDVTSTLLWFIIVFLVHSHVASI